MGGNPHADENQQTDDVQDTETEAPATEPYIPEKGVVLQVVDAEAPDYVEDTTTPTA